MGIRLRPPVRELPVSGKGWQSRQTCCLQSGPQATSTAKSSLMATKSKEEYKEILRQLCIPAPSELFPESCSV